MSGLHLTGHFLTHRSVARMLVDLMFKKLHSLSNAFQQRFETALTAYHHWAGWRQAFVLISVCVGLLILPYHAFRNGEWTLGWKAIGLTHTVTLSDHPTIVWILLIVCEVILLLALAGLVRFHLSRR